MKTIINKPIIIFGNSSTAKLVAWLFDRDSEEVAAFTVNRKYIVEATFYSKPVVPFETIAEQYPPDKYNFYAALGASRMNDFRREVLEKARGLGYNMVSLVSKQALIYQGFSVPYHCRIGDGAIIQPFAKLGANTVVAGGSIVGHDTIVGDNTFIAAGAVIGGGVQIGKNCFIGTGSVIRSKITLGDRTVVGAGVTLLESSEPESVYMNTATQKMPFPSSSIKF